MYFESRQGCTGDKTSLFYRWDIPTIRPELQVIGTLFLIQKMYSSSQYKCRSCLAYVLTPNPPRLDNSKPIYKADQSPFSFVLDRKMQQILMIAVG